MGGSRSYIHTISANNENAIVTDSMTAGDLLALTNRFGELLAMARRINEAGTPEERYIASTVMERAGYTLHRLQKVVDAWASNRSPTSR